jgi:peptidoglycan hydrolase CwlO-like protein
MAHNQEANDALTTEVKDLVKELQERNRELFSKIDQLNYLVVELRQQLADTHDRIYDI